MRAVDPAGRAGDRRRSVRQQYCGAKLHADRGHLSIDYRCTTVEEMDVRERFDIVLAMEVVEHVSDVGMFLAAAQRCSSPAG